MRSRSARRGPLLHELVVAPLSALLLVLCIFLFPRPGIGDAERCACGAILRRSSNLPRLSGSDPLVRAPVLQIDQERPGSWVATIDGTEVEEGDSDDDGPDWKVSKLAEQLEVRAHNERITSPGRTRPANLILRVPAGFLAKDLRRYLYTLGLVDHTRVQLLLRGQGGSYSAAYLKLVQAGDPPAVLELERFRTFEDLAQTVVALRREGLPALLRIFPR